MPIFYEPRQIRLNESEDFGQAVEEAQTILDDDENSYAFRVREQLMGSDSRIKKLAEDLVQHFEKRNELIESKAMVVATSRRICVKLYDEIVKLRPDWHSDDVNQGVIKVIMTSSASDSESMQAHSYSKPEHKTLEKRFKDPDDPLKIVIVRDMWLTGFDAPVCNTMYIDKPMQGHNLMQAIARVNRVFRNKSRENGGLIVDYVGLKEELKAATEEYTNAGGSDQVKTDIEQVFQKMLEYLSIIRGQFATPVNGEAFDLVHALQERNPKQLLDAIGAAADHILDLDHQEKKPDAPQSAGEISQDFAKKAKTPRKRAFLEAVSLAKKGLALCRSMPKAQHYEQEIAFFDAVRATIIKTANQQGSPSSPKEKQIKLVRLLNQAVQSDGVVDLFELMGEEHPDISILSDNFLGIVKKSGKPNLWASAIESYLKREIRDKAGNNIAVQKTFEEKLKEALNQYNAHNLTVIEVIKELLKLAKELQDQLAKGQELGLSTAELAFYDALSQNQSAVEILGDEVLLNLAKEITDKLKKSVTIDWQYKESVRAKMRVLIKRALKKYKYPPDDEPEAIEFILKQAEVVSDELSKA